MKVPYKNLNLIKIKLSDFNRNKNFSNKIMIDTGEVNLVEGENSEFSRFVNIDIVGKESNVSDFLESVNGLTQEDSEPECIDTIFYLKNVAVCYRNFGWASKSKEDKEMSTHSMAMQNIDLRRMKSRNFMGHKDWLEPTIRDVRFAEKSLEWIHETNQDDPIIKDIIRFTSNNDYIQIKHCPTVAITIMLFDKFRRSKTNNFEFESSQPLGEKGDNIEINCKVIRMKFFSRFTWFSMSDEDGNKITWFCDINPDIDIGDKIKVKATVSDIRHYQDLCETVINKVRIISYE